MRNVNERPVCHRAEDLVTYLYGEATATEARDFAAHLQQCDACRAELALFNQVHDSIVAWRNEALGSSAPSIVSPVAEALATPFVQHERKLSALAALREFFSVSPLWLRGATAFAGFLLCVLLVFAASRLWQTPVQVVKTGTELSVDQQEFDQAVQKEVDKRLAALAATKDENRTPEAVDKSTEGKNHPQLATHRVRSKRTKGLSQEERVQLAADLGLIPSGEDELPFVLPEEPN